MKKMNIALMSSSEYSKYAFVMLKSLFISNEKYDITVYFLYKELKENIIIELKDFTEKYNQKIEFIKVNLDDWKEFDINGLEPEVYLEAMIPYVLPENIDRVLYLGIDIIVRKDLGELYFKNFEENYLIACTHTGNTKKDIENIKTGICQPDTGDCFNSDVVVMDLTKLRKINLDEYIKLKNHKFSYSVQGLLNYMFWDKTLYEDTKIWNNRLHECNIDEIAIMHFSATIKPWDIIFDNGIFDKINENNYFVTHFIYNQTDFYKEKCIIWWEYAKGTPYYNIIQKEAEIRTNFFKKVRHNWISELDVLNKRVDSLSEKNKKLSYLLVKMEEDKKWCQNVKERYSSIAIYGMGVVGDVLLKKCQESKLEVKYYIDQKNKCINLPYKEINEIDESVGAIIICALYGIDEIKEKIKKYSNVKCISIIELFE